MTARVTSKDTNIRTGSGCPHQVLREFIIHQIQGSRNGRGRLMAHVRSEYPLLWEQVKPRRDPSGRVPWFQRLYLHLGLTYYGECASCGKPTGFSCQTMSTRRHCSLQCVNSDPSILKKRKDSHKARTGYESHFHNPSVRQKIRKTLTKRYRTSNIAALDAIKRQRSETYYARTGYENPAYNPDVIEKRRNTVREKYGCDHVFQNEQVKDKSRGTYLRRTGFLHPAHNPEVEAKKLRKSFQLKTYVSPSGKTFNCRGYEPKVLDFLFTDEHVTYVTTSPKKMPKVWHQEGHRYFPDIRLVRNGKTRFIEVKSLYTLRDNWEVNLQKFRSMERYCNEYGGSFWLAIVDRRGNIRWMKNPSKHLQEKEREGGGMPTLP